MTRWFLLRAVGALGGYRVRAFATADLLRRVWIYPALGETVQRQPFLRQAGAFRRAGEGILSLERRLIAKILALSGPPALKPGQ